MGRYGALLELPAVFPGAWRKGLMLPQAAIQVSGTTVTVRRGKCAVAVFPAKGPPVLKGKPVLVVQYGGFSRRTREENASLAEEVIEKLIALGAKKLERRATREEGQNSGDTT